MTVPGLTRQVTQRRGLGKNGHDATGKGRPCQSRHSHMDCVEKDTVLVDTLRNNWTVVDSGLEEKHVVTEKQSRKV